MATRNTADAIASATLYLIGVTIVIAGVLTLLYQTAWLLRHGTWPRLDLALLLNLLGAPTPSRAHGASSLAIWITQWPLAIGLISVGAAAIWISRVTEEVRRT